jgi:hypothetical protein
MQKAKVTISIQGGLKGVGVYVNGTDPAEVAETYKKAIYFLTPPPVAKKPKVKSVVKETK